MSIFASLFAAIVPSVLYLIFIWKYDKYDPEPIGLYLKNFFWGAIGAVFFAIIGNLIVNSFVKNLVADSIYAEEFDTIVIAPFVEEITKGIFLFSTVAKRKFDNVTDGIVYGGAIGLGFGMTENFFYFIANSDSFANWFAVVLIRTFFTAVMHCVSTAVFGAFLGAAKFKGFRYKLILPPIGLAIAIFIHSAWNFSVSFTSTTLIGFLFLIGTIILFLSAFSLSIYGEKKMILRELREEVNNGLFDEKYLQIISSDQRKEKGWIDESIREKFSRDSISLAFRKMQTRNSIGVNRNFYESEAALLRDNIKSYFADPEKPI